MYLRAQLLVVQVSHINFVGITPSVSLASCWLVANTKRPETDETGGAPLEIVLELYLYYCKRSSYKLLLM